MKPASTTAPTYTAAYWPLGKALEALGRVEDARTAYERGLSVGESTRDAIPIQKMRARLRRLDRQKAGEA